MITRQFIEAECVSENAINHKEIRINCPECNDTKYHMYCNLAKMVYVCHKCGIKGKIVDESTSNMESFKALYDRLKGQEELKYKGVPITFDPPKRTLPLCYPIDPENRAQLRAGRELDAYHYLQYRGVTDKEIDDYLISYTPDKDYIVFPIYGPNIAIRYWVSRNINPTSNSPKYINAPWPKDEVLYYAYVDYGYGVHTNGVIVEGIFDAIAISRAGYTGIALLGKKANTKQLERLIDAADKGYIIFLDDDAFTYAVELQQQLRILANIDNKPNLQFRIMHVSGMDPAACALKDMDKLRKELDEQNTQFKLGATKSTTVPKK